tara:strand:- start:5 stop:397 length:393 start_codon:yes stop_codon:yes gene_type:complete
MADRNEQIQACRHLLDFLEENPKIPMPDNIVGRVTGFLHCEPEEELALAQDILRTPGPWDKVFISDFIELLRTFKSGDTELKLEINCHRRNVCTRRKVGTEIRKALPACEVDIYEYDCPSSILALGKGKE